MHKVISGFTLIGPDFEINKTVVTKVFFNHLTDEIISAYVSTGSPMDKAGAYGIQDDSFHLVDRIEGSYDNVMGFPTEVLRKEFVRLGLID
jgi:predicted house-cleaning NTP pyrophosphatase (Maf/HAM1 superfamily)